MNENIYSEVMYAVLDEIKGKSSHNSNSSKPENIVGGLISTEHSYLIDHILGNENLTRQTFKEILEGYFQTGQLKKFLEILNQYPEQEHHNFNFEKYIEKLVQEKSSEENILDFAKYILSLGYESTKYINKLLETLWENKQFEIAKKIIDTYLSQEEGSIFNIIHNLYQGKVPTSEEIVDAIEKISSIQSKNNEKNWELEEKVKKITNFLLTELVKNNIDIPILKSFIIVCENKKLLNPLNKFNNSELYKKIREYYYEKKEWEEAEEFIKATGGYYQGELMNKIFEHAIEEKNKELHEETLNDYILQKDKEIENLTKRSNEWESEWEKHSNLCKANAEKNCELAIFELLYGEKTKAQKYLSLMIQFTESITENIPEGCSKSDKDIIKLRIKKPFKKELKERFLSLCLFEYLPPEAGWNIPIKDPQQRKGEKEKNENRKWAEQLESKEEENLKNEKKELEKTQWVQLLLKENNTDEAIKYIAKDSAWYTSRENWERGMLILDYSPPSFQKIFQPLSRECFIKSSAGDYSDYESMAQFFAKGITLGVVGNDEWKSLLNNVIRYRGGEYGDGYIFHDLITSLIKYIIEVGEVGKAWELFKNSKEDMHKSSISSCLYYLINASSNPIRKDGVTLAFNNRILEDIKDISQQEKVKYLNTKANIGCSFQDDEGYKSSTSKLQETIKNSENPTQAIRTWCKGLVNHCLRNHHQIKDELEVFLNSDFGKCEEIRRRIIYTLIELKVPGMEAVSDIKKKNNPERVQHLFFSKLIEKNYITIGTEIFLGENWREHIPHLRRLLAQYQNEFNTVIEKLSNIIYNKEDAESKNEILHSFQWKNVFHAISLSKKLYKKLQGETYNEENPELERQFFRKNFSLIFDLQEKNYFSSQEKIDHFYNLFDYVNIHFLKALSSGKEFFENFINNWDGTMNGFISTFINLDYLEKNITDNRLSVLKNFKNDEELKKFFITFILGKKLTGGENEIEKIFAQQGLEKFSEQERNYNIKRVNKQQSKFLRKKNKDEGNDYNWKKVVLENYDEKKRILVLYCRHYQISPIDFSILAKTMQEYIKNSYSKIFNNIIIVSRESGEYYEEFVSGIEYKDVKGKDFQETCSVFANTIHFTHGQPIENKFNSIPILSASVRGDSEKMKNIDTYVPLHLKLDPRDHIQIPKGENILDGDMEKMVNEILRAVKDLEKQILSNIKKEEKV